MSLTPGLLVSAKVASSKHVLMAFHQQHSEDTHADLVESSAFATGHVDFGVKTDDGAA